MINCLTTRCCRLAKFAMVLLTLACVLTAPSNELEAVTLDAFVNESGTSTGLSLTVGDKTFSNFSFDTTLATAPDGTTLNLPEANDIVVTATVGAGGVISLTFPLNMSAITTATAAGIVFGNVILGFDVTAADPNLITGVTVTATGEAPVAASPFTGASIVAEFSDTTILPIVVDAPGAGSTNIPGLTTLGVSTTADVVAGGTSDSAEIDVLTFQFAQTPRSMVAEPGSLILVVGGLGMLLTRACQRRRG